jgi:hypothetical protein
VKSNGQRCPSTLENKLGKDTRDDQRQGCNAYCPHSNHAHEQGRQNDVHYEERQKYNCDDSLDLQNEHGRYAHDEGTHNDVHNGERQDYDHDNPPDIQIEKAIPDGEGAWNV